MLAILTVTASDITAGQIRESLLAIPAFIPALVCVGYVVGWLTDLHGFRGRSLVERIFWSLPLSLGVSTITAYLVGKFVSLDAVVALFAASAVVCAGLLAWEWRERRRTGNKWVIGFRPKGWTALLLAAVWVAVVVLSLVDWQSGNQLYTSLFTYDHCYRVSWTESVLRTGVPPANPLYFYKHPAVMRNYYFWYVLCAAVVRMVHLPARAVFNASCIWAGFLLASLIGLYLKHFLCAGAKLRKQTLLCISLLAVTGLDIFVNLLNIFYLHRKVPGDLELWSKDPIYSWYGSLLWAPHHVASMECCMFAFLVAWLAGRNGARGAVVSVGLATVTLASAFGLSIYVAFGFFLVMIIWGVWQVAMERTRRSALLLAAGGLGAAVLLLPYLWELMRDTGTGAGSSVFGIAVREMIPPDGLLASHLFSHLAIGHPEIARNLANLLLLAPGYVVELGFYVAVFIVYLVPVWRGRTALSSAQRSLVFIAIAMMPFLSFLRSFVLRSNDFGWRAAMILQFALLLLASEVLTAWKEEERMDVDKADPTGRRGTAPLWFRTMTSLAIGVGVVSLLAQGLVLRFVFPIAVGNLRAHHVPDADMGSHDPLISTVGYGQLQKVIPADAVVQFNPRRTRDFHSIVDVMQINHQLAMSDDRGGCGSDLGGDPSGCPAMAAAVDSVYKGATATRAREVCGEYGIQYLVARVYDPAWKDVNSWVWTLPAVVEDPEFRALDCR